MFYAVCIHLGFSDFLQVHFTLPFFSRSEIVRFQLPSRSSPEQKEGAALPDGRYCLSVAQQDRRSPTGGAGISENGIKSSTQLLYFLTICKILNRKTKTDIKPPKPQTNPNEY